MSEQDISEGGKYYIPEINEESKIMLAKFLIWLPKQLLHKNQNLIDVNIFKSVEHNFAQQYLEETNKPIKYITKEDIEAEGFVEELDEIGYGFQSGQDLFVIRPFVGSTLFQILKNNQQIFLGTLKNKSELHKILIQIGLIK